MKKETIFTIISAILVAASFIHFTNEQLLNSRMPSVVISGNIFFLALLHGASMVGLRLLITKYFESIK